MRLVQHLAILATLVGLLAACGTYQAIESGKRIDIGNGMSAVVSGRWSAINGSAVPLGGAAAVWTVDGLSLNKLVFHSGLESGEPLDTTGSEEVREKRAKFRSSMTETGIMEFVESSFAQNASVAKAVASNLAPQTFIGRQGFRFEVDIINAEQIEYKALVTGAVVNGKLYMVHFLAPAIHFYQKEQGRVRAILQSVQLEGGSADA